MISAVGGVPCEVIQPVPAPDERENGSPAQVAAWAEEVKRADWQEYLEKCVECECGAKFVPVQKKCFEASQGK